MPAARLVFANASRIGLLPAQIAPTVLASAHADPHPIAIPNAFANHHLHAAHKRQTTPSVPTVLPGNWTSKGCFTYVWSSASNHSANLVSRDDTASRTLTGPTYTDTVNMTVENCIAFCSGASTGSNGIPAQSETFIFAGLEFAQECCASSSTDSLAVTAQIWIFHFLDCDNFIENGGTNATLTDCDMACTGDAAEACGGPNRLNLFFSGGSPPPQPIVVPSVGLWESLGCYTCVFFFLRLEMLLEILCKKIRDDVNNRTLSTGIGVDGDMTVPACVAACQADNFPLAGLEFATQCCMS